MKYFLSSILLLLCSSLAYAQTGNHVFTGAEAMNYSIISLATPGGQTWSTDRSATPGYFSALGNSTYTNAADNANVNGYVKYHAGSAPAASFIFPVGTGTDLRLLTVSGSIPATVVLASAWIVGDPSATTDPTTPNAGTHPVTSVGPGILSVSTTGMWDWQDISGDAAGLTITASIPDESGFATAANLRLVGWDGTRWVNLSAAEASTAASGAAENSTLTGTLISGITAIGIGSVNYPLPVHLVDFTAAPVGNRDALLQWRAEAQENFDRYEIEYSRTGVGAFVKTGVVLSNQLFSGSYSFTDPNAAARGTTLYYRLKVIDRDASYVYSDVRIVHFGKGPIADIRPTLLRAGQLVVVTLAGSNSNRQYTIQLVNAAGQLIRQQSVSGNRQFSIATDGLAPGIYILHLRGDELEQCIKLVVE